MASSLLVSSVSIFAKPAAEKIIGDNDLVIVEKEGQNIPLRYQKMLNAFGVVQFQSKDQDGLTDSFYGCTATHLGRGYVITAGHCVGAKSELSSQSDCSFMTKNPFETSTVVLNSVEFGYRDKLAPYMKSQCTEIVAAMKDDENGFDFAILKVSPAPEEFILPDTTRRSIIGDTVTIFSHPMGEVLQWSKTCGVERVLHPEIPGSFIQHQCDTKPGSSGAVIINALSLKIVGIHDGGLNDIDAATGIPLKTGMNYGTYILNSPLYEELKKLGF
jgi:V8-like Glu-specific endopeptidase